MKKRFNNKKGFTLAEALIVVAIVLVLAAVAFIAVWVYQRSMHHLEMDEYAKEIFIAAQNHLSAAAGQGYLDADENNADKNDENEYDFGYAEKDAQNKKTGVYYFIVNQGTVSPDKTKHAVLDYMLPFAAVDETVRTGYNYIIRYQKNPATVLDVFCATASDKKYGIGFKLENYSVVKATTGDRSLRRSFGDEKAVLGYYGGATAANLETITLKAPKLIVHNEDVLWVEIIDPNITDPNVDADVKKNAYLNLIIKGETSQNQVFYQLRLNDQSVNPESKGNIEEIKDENNIVIPGKYKVILDDITSDGLRFKQLLSSFYPGENIIIQAKAFSNSAISNIAYSAAATTNSIFDERTGDTVYIANARHLENLNESISGFNRELNNTDTIDINKAEQRSDIKWDSFTHPNNPLTEGRPVYNSSGDKFVPITIPKDTAAFTYDGKGHQIASITVDVSGNAGLFTSVSGDTISNLQLVDFSVSGTNAGALAANAGALAGEATNTEVTNVVAYNKSNSAAEATTVTIRGTGSGSVGGLIGSTKDSTISKCAASLVVSTTGENAGGLIGSATDGTVSASYSGGHTKGGAYTYVESNTTKYLYNVTGDKNVGGLIGSASGTSISNSYSTCSVQGTGESSDNNISYVGGFVGYAVETNITNSYSTGLVNSVTKNSNNQDEKDVEGAFVGSFTSGTLDGCKYYDIINERDANGGNNGSKGYEYLNPVGNSDSTSGISMIDADAASYEAFVGADSNWKSSISYDDILGDYYQDKYNLKTVEQLLGTSVESGDFVANHYGDWPAPEIWVINVES